MWRSSWFSIEEMLDLEPPRQRLTTAPSERRDQVWAQFDDVARLARQLCRNPEDAEDVTQSALLKAAEHVNDFRGDSTMRTWLHRITTNECHMLRRRIVARSVDDILEHERLSAVLHLASGESNPEQLAEQHRFGEIVVRAAQHLPARQHAAVVLLEGAELDVADVARRLGTSQSAVRSLLVRARRSIRAEVASATGTANQTPHHRPRSRISGGVRGRLPGSIPSRRPRRSP